MKRARALLHPCAALLLAGLLGGCGFHLAGSRPLPEALRVVYIDLVAPYRVSEPPVETALRALLQRRGAVVLSGASEDALYIRLSELEESRETLSVGSDGKVLEFSLTTRVRFEAFRGTQALVPADQIAVTRDLSFNVQQVLAKEAEEERLREFIQAEMAELLMLRLEAVLSRPTEPTAAIPDAAPGAD
jgi:LPS-assembly lipoprotein